MATCDEVSAQQELHHVRRSAAHVLQKYGMEQPRLKLLAHHRQTVFRVDVPDTGQRLVLRLHRTGYRSADSVRAEFSWLRHLRKRMSSLVPEPVPTLDGEDVVDVAAESAADKLHCSMTKWVAGRRYFRKRGPGARVLHDVGNLMARMHLQSACFQPPTGFQCPTWNRQQLFQQQTAKMIKAERALLGENHRLFEKAENIAGSAMDQLGNASDVFGLIHGDLMQANYVIHRREVRAIDFADFGHGHFLYDIAVTLFALWGLDETHRQRNAFLAGYRAVRPLPREHESLIDLFIAGRGVVQARSVINSPLRDDRKIVSDFLQHVTRGLRLWLAGAAPG